MERCVRDRAVFRLSNYLLIALNLSNYIKFSTNTKMNPVHGCDVILQEQIVDRYSLSFISTAPQTDVMDNNKIMFVMTFI